MYVEPVPNRDSLPAILLCVYNPAQSVKEAQFLTIWDRGDWGWPSRSGGQPAGLRSRIKLP